MLPPRLSSHQPRLSSRHHVPLPERKRTPSLPPLGTLKWAQALSLTLTNNRIPKRSCCEQFRPILGTCSRSSNRRYYVHEHHTWWITRRELNTAGSCG